MDEGACIVEDIDRVVRELAQMRKEIAFGFPNTVLHPRNEARIRTEIEAIGVDRKPRGEEVDVDVEDLRSPRRDKSRSLPRRAQGMSFLPPGSTTAARAERGAGGDPHIASLLSHQILQRRAPSSYVYTAQIATRNHSATFYCSRLFGF